MPRSSRSAPSSSASSTPVEPRATVTETETKTRTETRPGTPVPAPPTPPPAADRTSPCTYTGSTPSIQEGATGPAVQQAQCLLNFSLSGGTIPEDGDFGPVTDAATRRFQDCAGITVDGLIGPETWSYLIAWAAAPSFVC
ncbi:peptidoglycan-binding protein [Streptomyces sp. NPDC060194]|uniref:peptidoglycan-binding domain-containing protein n=1 Tax=Streptomyces sp. NPDC060194 TaxID=3347069 RepID=UPI00364EC60D